MAELMEVIEAAAYMAFVLLAVFAVFELRIMARDRKLEFAMRQNEFICTKEFQEPLCKLWETEAQDADELEKEVSYTGLSMLADYFAGLALLAEDRLMDERIVAMQYNYIEIWKKLKPWVLRLRIRHPQIYKEIEELAEKSRLRYS
ncbi:MAG: hypothetical protein JSU93_03150 [Methanobacteriota archaeon]|nr:MAG: hypothetical protein JSU93_03150 [Euryarchaeota archaeon]